MKLTAIILSLLIATLPMMGQSSSDSYSQSFSRAKSAYDIGNIEEARSILSSGLKDYDGQLKLEALHLLSLCCLADDEPEAAEQYARQLLREDPFYRASLDDTPRFTDLLESLKSSNATVTSASQLAETLEEVPVPTTLITEEMIANSGCTNLQELLCLYVPGMTKIDDWESNIAMHGVYGMYQEKILVMLNGHRLNSRTTNSETLDFRHSLSKIKQIEVLRGAASSLYGNVALTAVINIITKRGNEVDGAKVSAAMGSFDTWKADFLMGKRYLDVDFTAWASIYSSKGQRLELNPGDKYYYSVDATRPGYMYIDGYNGKSSYDIGVTANWKGFSFLYNTQYSKKISSYSAYVTYGLYDYDKYVKIQGLQPGISRKSDHLELSYATSSEKTFFSAKAFLDIDNTSFYHVMGDTLSDKVYNWLLTSVYPRFTDTSTIYPSGAFSVWQFEDYVYGVYASGGYNYNLWKTKGVVLAGIQFERYCMYDNSMTYGDSYDRVFTYNGELNSEKMGYRRIILYGKETNLSGYVQIKHNLPCHLIVNGGLRYDYKRQYNERNLNSLSPRIALIWNVAPNVTLKASYAHSFVDASYIYRANTSATYGDGSKLTPEKMDAYQITANLANSQKTVNYEVNAFYNKLKDLVAWEYTDGEDYGMFNIGKLDLFGIDNSFSYKDKRQSVVATASYMRVVKTKNDYYVNGKEMFNVPPFYVNLAYNRTLLAKGDYTLTARATASYRSSYNNFYQNAVDTESVEVATVNAGAECRWKQFTISFDLNNIFDADYAIGSQLELPYPQKGRNCLLSVAYSIK